MSTHISLIHEGKKPFKCEDCDISFGLKKYLQNHIISIHTTARPFKCSICDKDYKLKVQLKKHTEDFHINSNDSITTTSANISIFPLVWQPM